MKTPIATTLRRTARLMTSPGLPVAVLVFFFFSNADYAVQAQNSRTPADENPSVRVGEFAPDFELPRLTITTASSGEPIGLISETDTVRLSSFRGKKPVCLIMSSYT